MSNLENRSTAWDPLGRGLRAQVKFDTANALGVFKVTQFVCFTEEFAMSKVA